MARIRFAGRPSRRIRSNTFSSVHDELERNQHTLDALDPKTRLLINVQRGLRHFSELAGPCDEGEFAGFDAVDIDQVVKKLSALAALREELVSRQFLTRRKSIGDELEFTGFSVRDVRQVEKRISALQAMRAELANYGTLASSSKSQKCSLPCSVPKKASHTPESVSKAYSQSVSSMNLLSPARQSLKGNIKVRLVLGSGRPLTTLLSSTKKVSQKETVRKKKILYSSESSDSESVMSSASSAVKYCLVSKKSVLPRTKVAIPVRPTKNSVAARARQLLTKARCREPRVEPEKCPPRWHLQIQLPQQSSRSSRKITLNKRFMDEGYTTFSQMKKPKLDETLVNATSIQAVVQDSVVSTEQSFLERQLNCRNTRKVTPVLKPVIIGSSDLDSSTKGELESQENIRPFNSVVASLVGKAKRFRSRTGPCTTASLKRTDRIEVTDCKSLEVNLAIDLSESRVFPRAAAKSCEICSNTYKVARYYNSSVPVCRACSRFFIHYQKQIAEGKESTCSSGGQCKLLTFKLTQKYMCLACRFASCLKVFPEKISSQYKSASLDYTHETEDKNESESNEPSPCIDSSLGDLTTGNTDSQIQASTSSVSGRPKRIRQRPAALDDMDCNSFEISDASEKYRRNRESKTGRSRDSTISTADSMLKTSESKTPVRRRSKISDVAIANSPSDLFMSPPILSLSGRINQTTDNHNSNEGGLHNLLQDEDLMNFAAAVDRSLENSSSVDLVGSKNRLIDTRPDYYPADMVQSENSNAFIPGEVETTAVGARGPRIKHVCRRAAVALGKPMALFPMAHSLSLSALPSQEKERVLEGTGSRMPDSDGRVLDQISQSPVKSGETQNSRLDQAKLPDTVESDDEFLRSKKKGRRVGVPKTRNRRKRCNQCSGCLAPTCGVCESCKDMPKFGGRGILKKACMKRLCIYLSLPDIPVRKTPVRKETVMKKSLVSKEKLPQSTNLETKSSDAMKGKRVRLGGIRPYKAMLSGGLGSKIYSGMLSSKSRPRLFGLKGSAKDPTEDRSEKKLKKPVTKHLVKVEKFSRRKQKHLIKDDDECQSLAKSLPSSSSLNNMSTTSSTADDNRTVAVVHKVKHEKGVAGTKFNPFNSQVLPTSSKVQHVIKVDCKEDMVTEEAWRNGVALISSSPLCLRAVCWLCGSLGQEPLIYCTVCCEPFHSFCLEENQRPLEGFEDTWSCQKCQYCCICYGQNNLLQCDTCQGCYHTHCIGSNYPTGRSKRKIWVCHKCVRCKSCGTTSPGPDPDSVWMHDFSLCMACGKLMDKGNFCPVCHKCYVDDDWDSQMMQCSKCRQWVHSSCEQLTDEMYQVVVYMPEDVPFNCRVCCGNQPSTWELMVRQEMNNCMLNVMDVVMASKCVKQIRPVIKQTDAGSLKTNSGNSLKSGSKKSQQSNEGKSISESSDNNNAFKAVSNSANHLKPHMEHCDIDLSIIKSDTDSASSSLVPSNNNTDLTKQLAGNSSSTRITETLIKNNVNDHIETVNTCFATPHHKSSSTALDQQLPAVPQVDITATTEAPLPVYESETVQTEPLVEPGEEEKKFPVCFKEVEGRLDLDDYKSVEEFACDMLRILLYNASLANDSESSKAGNIIRELFLKQLSKQFPWFNIHNPKIWNGDSTEKTAPRGDLLDNSVAPPSQDHIYAQWTHRAQPPAPVQLSVFKQPCFGQQQVSAVTAGNATNTAKVIEKDLEQVGDTRHCNLCWVYGDCNDDGAGRLLYAGQDDWVHINCALWSAEVYEEGDGSLQAVHTAMARGRKLRCDSCAKPGATVGCCQAGCFANYHFMCARRSKCSFRETKKVFCRLHRNINDGELMEDGSFGMTRRTWVDVEGSRSVKRQWATGLEPSLVNVLKGSLSVDSLGTLTRLSDTKSALLPVGYSISRLFWSTVDPRRRCVYTCRIFEVVPKVVASSLPVVIKESTISHDENDPNYNAALAATYCVRSRARSVDEDTESASEEELMSSSDSCAEDDPIVSSASFLNNDQQMVSISNQSSLNSKAHPVTSSIYSPNVPSLSRSYPTGATLWKEKQLKKSPSFSSSDSSIKESPKVSVGSLGFSGLSQDTLRLLGINTYTIRKEDIQNMSCQNSAVVTEKLTAGGDDMLLSMARRLNEAAAKSSRSKTKLSTENSIKNTGAGDGFCRTDSHLERGECNTSDDTPRETSQSSVPINDKPFQANTLSGASAITNGIELPIVGNIRLPLKYSLSIVPKRMASLSNLSSNADGLRRIDQTDGPPYETDQEDGDALHLVADFSSDDESMAKLNNDSEENEQTRCSEGASNAADDCGPSTSGETSKVIIDGADKQERCQVVLRDVFKLGLTLHDGVCHLKSGVDEVSDSNVLSTTSHELSSTINVPEVHSIEIPRDVENPSTFKDKTCVRSIDSTVSKKAATNHILVKSLSAHKHSTSHEGREVMCDVTVSSCESLPQMSSSVTNEMKNVNALIADIVSCPSSESKSVAVSMNVSQKHQFFPSSQSATSAKVSTCLIGSSGQKVNSANSAVHSSSIISSRAAISSISHSTVGISQIAEPKSIQPPASRSSKVVSLNKFYISGLPSSDSQQLTMKQAPVAPDVSVQLSSVQRTGSQVFLTSTESASISNHTVRPCVTHVPLTSSVLQASVRPVCPAPVASVVCDRNTSPQVETLQQLLASAKLSKPFFIRVSTDEQTTSKTISSSGSQEYSHQEAAISMQQNLKLNTTVDSRSGSLSAGQNVAVSQSGNTRLTKVESSQHMMKSYNNAPEKRVHGPTVLTDASNQPLIRRKFRMKLKDLSSPHAENSPDSSNSHTHMMTSENDDELRDSPLLAMFRMEERRRQNGIVTTKKDVPHLMFEITSDDGFSVQADSFKTAWRTLTDKVQDARLSAGMQPVSFTALNGLDMYGLTNPTIVYLVEQLYGAHRCNQYEFKFNRNQDINPDEEDDLVETEHGCSRAESFSTRKRRDMFAFLLSRYRVRPAPDQSTAEDNNFTNNSQRRTTSLDLPMAMRFRALPRFAREAVGVYPSLIHGRGLFCRRALDAGEMIIEYSGEMIRAILCDKRENSYEARGIGCYMFRKDRDYIIDSTMMGNPARFINHSCDPNCYSKVILVDGRKHIVIFALRAIRRGEELTYDYKFPIEDIKIPCSCRSLRCRRYLN